MAKEASLYSGLGEGKVECTACSRRCKIPDGSRGFCFVRRNEGGKLFLDTYGIASAVQLDPIEKKPFNHFHPGTYVLGIGTSSCNWGCQFCQNHNISKEKEIEGAELGPEGVVEMAISQKAESIAFTYNEPAIFIEYALDVARIAHERGLYTLFVTNGYMTKEAVSAMKGLIDAAVVDFKGSGEQKFTNKYEIVMSIEPIKEAILEMRRAGIHLEFTDLIIPRVGESLEACDELTKWISENVGSDAPIQFTAFHPDYRMLDYPQTPYAALKAHYDVAKRNGLDYVYIGNVFGNEYESTYCPGCGSRVIGRDGHYLTSWSLDKENNCKECGTTIPIIGGRPSTMKYREILSFY